MTTTTPPVVDSLSAFDAQFLYWDSDVTPLNMGNICIFEGKPLFNKKGAFRLADVRKAIDSRLHMVPRYRRKLLELPGDVGHPVLVDDPDFDIANHVKLVKLPAPGNLTQLKEAFAHAHEGMLDRSRPLWEITFVEGLEDGRVGMIQKIHHAPFDGATTVEVIEHLLDHSPKTVSVDPPPWDPPPPPDPMSLVGLRWMEQATQMLESLQPYVAPTAPERLGELSEAMEEVGRMGAPPKTSLNGPVGPRRRFDWVATTLSEAKEIRSLVPGSTVNDAMLAVIAGGLRALLAGRGENVDEMVLQVMVPVSMRTDSEKAGASGNQVTGFVAPLPICVPDAIERLRRIHTATKELKEGKQALGIHAMTQAVDFAPPALMAAAGRMAIEQASAEQAGIMNLTVTNVPGPREELFLLGARMLELNPQVPIGNNITVNVAVESYVDNLSLGICADADACPDLDLLAGGIRDSLDELLAAARS